MGVNRRKLPKSTYPTGGIASGPYQRVCNHEMTVNNALAAFLKTCDGFAGEKEEARTRSIRLIQTTLVQETAGPGISGLGA